jgi:hypothetical protein
MSINHTMKCHEVPWICLPYCHTLLYLAISCHFLLFLHCRFCRFAFFFPPDLTDFWEHCPLRCGKDDVGGCVLSTRRPKWNSRRTGRTGRTGHGQPVRLLHNLWGFQCDKMWQERNAVRFPELKNFRNVSAFLRFGGQAEDIDPRFPWPLQHGFREEFSIGGRVKGLRNDRVRLYPPNPFLLYDTKRKHEETRTFPTDKLKEYICICVYIYIILEYVYIYIYTNIHKNAWSNIQLNDPWLHNG